jgi:hypothetical protein
MVSQTGSPATESHISMELFPKNGIMGNLTCLPSGHGQVTDNATFQAIAGG